jgi:uncharacterized protein YacL (UPF0231 family)
MKQTAVEWLYDEIENNAKCIYEVIEQAKTMEKEQICNAYIYGAAYGIDVPNNLIPNTYYNETFKSE